MLHHSLPGPIPALFVLLTLSASLFARQGRQPIQLQETATNSPDGGADSREGSEKPTEHQMQTTQGAEAESDETFELGRDPLTRRIEGLDTGTDKIPAHLKGNPYRLSFVSGDHIPRAGERLDPLLAKTMREASSDKRTTYGFVMFQGRITRAKLERVRRLGVELYDFHTFQSYKARIPFASVSKLLGSRDVRWIGQARPAQKMTSRLLAKIEGRESGQGNTGILRLYVNLFEVDKPGKVTRRLLTTRSRFPTGMGVDGEHWTELPGGPFQRQLEKLGCKIEQWLPELKAFVVTVAADRVYDLAELDFVHAMEMPLQMITTHDRSTRQIGTDYLRKSSSSNGRTTVMGIIDTGVYVRNSLNTKGHKDLAKWTKGWDYLNTSGYWTDTNGHGTHVAGTMLGTGTASKRLTGNAPGAGAGGTTRFFIGKAIPSITGTEPISVIQKFRKSATIGTTTTPRPHVVNGSYGTAFAPSGGYIGTDVGSRSLDISVYYYQQLYVISAGNSGGQAGNETWKSVGAPGVAKNALSVGNAYDKRSDSGILLNRRAALTATKTPKNRIYMIEIPAKAGSSGFRHAGMSLTIKAVTKTKITCHLYLAGTGGKPANSPVRSVSVDVGTSEKQVTAIWPTPYSLPAGATHYIGYTTSATVDCFGAWSSFGKPVTHYEKSAISGAWSAAKSQRWQAAYWWAGETGELNYSSSKGATGDGRIKPNVMAPGTKIASCKAGTEGSYTEMTGTSMASPHVAGLAADLLDNHSTWKYKPYLTKALIAAAANPFGNRIYKNTQNSQAYHLRQGLGMVDARKANASSNSSKGWRTGYGAVSMSSTTQGSYFDVSIPSDATSIKVVLNFDESEASASATRACKADMDLYLDVAPFQSGYNTGEYSSRRAWDTWEWVYITSGSLMNSIKGKTLRIKVNPRVRPSFGLARVGIAYVIQRGGTSPNTNLTLTAPTLVRPGTNFLVTPRVDVLSASSTNGFLTLTDNSDFLAMAYNLQAPDGLTRFYPYLPQMSSDSLRDATLGNLYHFYGSAYRSVNWTLRADSEGVKTLCFELRSDNRINGDSINSVKVCKTICVDGKSPLRLGNLKSTSHTKGVWSSNPSLSMRWSAATDVGCAGVAGIGTRVGPTILSPTTKNLPATTRQQTVSLATSRSGYYFTTKVWDKVGNMSLLYSFGPVYVDAVPPTISAVSLNNGAAYAKSTTIPTKISANDATSGLFKMRYSWNGSTWSPWFTYKTILQASLLTAGGSTASGIKTLKVQVTDRASNKSLVRSDSIIFDNTAPSGKVTINSGQIYTRSFNVLLKASATDTGSGLRYMSFSGNGVTWSPKRTYSTVSQSWNLSSYGGTLPQGVKRVYARFEDRSGNVSSSVSDTILLDSVVPTVTRFVINSMASHTNVLAVKLSITGSDATSGVKWMRFSNSGSVWSPWAAYSTSPVSWDLSKFGGSTVEGTRTVYSQLQDGAGGTSAIRTDTIVYDKTAPLLTNVSFVPASAYTSSLSHQVGFTWSGVAWQYRWSMNGTTWSTWSPLPAQNRFLANLASNGGTTATGLKMLRVMLRDVALNESPIRSASIRYYPQPVVTSLSLTSLEVVHDQVLSINGSGFADVDKVLLGTIVLTQNGTDWYKGSFKVQSDTRIVVQVPQDLAPKSLVFKVQNPAFSASSPTLKIVHNTTRKLGISAVIDRGKNLSILVHRATMPALTLDLMTFSASNKALLLSGLVSMAHGGNTVSFIDPSFTVLSIAVPHNATRRTARWTLPVPANAPKIKLYFQALMFDPANFSALPIRTSTMGSVTLR